MKFVIYEMNDAGDYFEKFEKKNACISQSFSPPKRRMWLRSTAE